MRFFFPFFVNLKTDGKRQDCSWLYPGIMVDRAEYFLPYHEPGIRTILVQSSLIKAFDSLIFCGFITWGTPGAKWLDMSSQDTIVQLGYLGVFLYSIIFISSQLQRRIGHRLSVPEGEYRPVGGCGSYRGMFPHGYCFVLQPLAEATPLQAFAAGAALCSTSLGTTFTILNTSGLLSTRLGTVLIISNLGKANVSFNPVSVIRPLAVSFGLTITVPLVCRFIVKPLTLMFNKIRQSNTDGYVNRPSRMTYTPFILHTFIFFGLVTSATIAGTSNLFAAYLAGASISWWDSEVSHPEVSTKNKSSTFLNYNPKIALLWCNPDSFTSSCHVSLKNGGLDIYHKYYAPVTAYILKPLFFVCFPINDMFHSETVWKGIVFSILMLLGKVITGIWLMRLNISWPKPYIPKSIRSVMAGPVMCFKRTSKEQKCKRAPMDEVGQGRRPISNNSASESSNPNYPSSTPSRIKKPLSLYPAAMLGTAIVSCGEIGFLIVSLAETNDLFSSHGELYLIVTWATEYKNINQESQETIEGKVKSSRSNRPFGAMGYLTKSLKSHHRVK
ncbi:conserved hypothetical protein [Microsporum canis CBS 113480]|uniref:Uncharacterized protein n=1 Tax=Arthroderma otae (strain ATCC MYA-4605 / CBS 113480) TaxID=554155 RepID=C5FCN7_ARTOC|nr:conserved hypothetical protein [Microsporum canis CBS 113480]EEQ27571.1 conserved hypothetical protein [Microsporum canis CBS 113480]